MILAKGGKDNEDKRGRKPRPRQRELGAAGFALEIVGSSEFRDAILATTVDRFSNPRYWEDWAKKVGDIARRHEARIRALLKLAESGVQPIFADFLSELRHNLNDGISEDDAIAMLSQHLVAKPVFDALFAGSDFQNRNPVSRSNADRP